MGQGNLILEVGGDIKKWACNFAGTWCNIGQDGCRKQVKWMGRQSQIDREVEKQSRKVK